MRVLFAFLISFAFLIVGSFLVAFCTLFISSNSINCQDVPIPTINTIDNSTSTTSITCFCNSNLFNFGDGSVQTLCRNIFKKLYIYNGLQIAAAVISSATNFLFGIFIDKIINFTKPANMSSGLISKTSILFLFFLINTCLLPLLLYANIYGFKIASYISLVALILPSQAL
jgi:hypothetical protein